VIIKISCFIPTKASGYLHENADVCVWLIKWSGETASSDTHHITICLGWDISTHHYKNSFYHYHCHIIHVAVVGITSIIIIIIIISLFIHSFILITNYLIGHRIYQMPYSKYLQINIYTVTV
jgi:hypothetical protein